MQRQLVTRGTCCAQLLSSAHQIKLPAEHFVTLSALLASLKSLVIMQLHPNSSQTGS